MGWLKRETAYDRRLREMDEEAERIRKSMQQLMKSVPRASTSQRPAPEAPLSRPPAYRASGRPPEPRWDEDAPAADDGIGDAPGLGNPREMATPVEAPRGAGAATPRPDRLVNYLASGSFGKSRSLNRERRIQRNKAVMMLIFALLAIYSLYSWLK